MDPSSVLHSQDMGIGNNSLDNMLVCSKSQQDKKPRPQQEQALRCPRCDSLNTKFCYYNNYSLTQPRYFCKSCRRYWTKGGTLRNVPVGGGCRKNNKRPSSSCSSSSSISSKLRAQDHLMNITTHNNLQQHLSFNDCNDLTLAFSRLQNNKLGFEHHDHLSFLGNNNHYDHILGNPNFTNATTSTNFHVAPNNGNFENMYYGGGAFGNNINNNMGEVVDNGNGDQMMLPFDHDHANTQAMVVTTMKQESEDNNNNKILWGFPWQQMGDNGNNNMGDHLDLRRDSNWNNASLAPSWHGLLNSTPLM